MPLSSGSPAGAPRVQGPRLVGRAGELRQLDAEVELAVRGGFRVALIEGGPGIGKTRLAREVLERHTDGATCLFARSHRWGATTSFDLWAEALDRHLRDRSEAEVRKLAGPSLDDLAFLLKSVEVAAPTGATPPQRTRLLQALASLLDRLSVERPVLIAFDDAHLADVSSWEALHYLGQRLSDSSIWVLATARHEDLRRHPIASDVLLSLGEDGLLHRLRLSPLTQGEVAQLAGGILQARSPASTPFVVDALVTWLFERSLGHPLFVVSLLEALLDEQADLTAPRLERMPEGLRERVAVELHALGQEEQKTLEMLAVVDRRIGLGDLVRLSGREMDELAEPLENLVRSRLVTEHETGTGLRYEVAHPVIQEAVYEEIGGARRRSLHRSVARALLESGQLGAAAGHYARSAEQGDAEAVDILCRAMRQAEDRGLYEEALATLRALLEILPAGDRRWLRVVQAMDWQAEWVLGHLAEGDSDVAIEAMRRIEPLVEETGDLAAQGTVQLRLAAFLSFGAGRLDEAEEACRRAISRFEAAGDHQRTLLARNELAWIRGCTGDLARTISIAGQVLEEAEAAGAVQAAIHATASSGYALRMMGRFDDAERRLRRSIELAQASDDSYRVTWGRTQLGVLLSHTGRLADATASLEAALRGDISAPDAVTLEYLSHTDWLAGRLTSSVARMQQSEARRPLRGSRRRAWGLALAARSYAEMGQHSRALRRADSARATYQGQHILEWAALCDWTDGILAWHNRDQRRALALLGHTVERLQAMGAAAYEPLVLVDVAEIAAESGDAVAARVAADRVAEVASNVGGVLYSSLAALATAWRHLVESDPDRAAATATEAGEALAAAGYRLWAGIALDVSGRALAGTDRRAGAAALKAAVKVFDRCGAAWRRDRTLALLSRLGSPGRRAAAAVQGPEALTDREREVASLAAQGYTAHETGQRLFISKRTVESHLESIYAKLGVGSKRELAQRAAELGL